MDYRVERLWGRMRFLSCPLPPTQPLLPLTIVEAGDTQGLCRVQREPVLGVLDVGHDGHGVEVGLQGQLLQIPPGLHLWAKASRSRAPWPRLGPQGVPSLKGSLATPAWFLFSIRRTPLLTSPQCL